ncbi:MAG: protease SohB [Granulosicoccaceae bacterium]
MAQLFAEYGIFLLKVVTFVIAAMVLIFFAVSMSMRGKRSASVGSIEVTKLNDQLEKMEDALSFSLLDPINQKMALKERKKEDKAKHKQDKIAAKKASKQRGSGETLVEEPQAKRVFVMDFDGDVRASAVENMRHEITAVLSSATSDDEVVLKLESGGGMVTSYGLAAAQLDRIRSNKIPLTVCVDKVAASGGYMMACVADKLVAAPFAVVGSIGVVAQIPNFHRLLKKMDIDFELLTAGKFKRTLTLFGENTDEGRDKFLEDIEKIHDQFKNYVDTRRPKLDIDTVATGEIWSGQDAVDIQLVDELVTSDEYLMKACEDSDVIYVKYKEKKPLMERFSVGVQNTVDGVFMKALDRVLKSRWSIS